MALIRRISYTAPSEWDAGDPVTGPTQGSFTFTGSNPTWSESPGFFTTSPLVDYERFQTEYAQDTMFGMLGSKYGPNMRRASTAEGFNTLYGDTSGGITTGRGELGVRASINYDIGNMAAEWGTVGFLRKINKDLTHIDDPAANAIVDNLLGQKYKSYGDFLYQREQMQSASSSEWNFSGGGFTSSLRSNEIRTPGGNIVASSRPLTDKARLDYSRSQDVARAQVTVKSQARMDWNEENVNYFGFGSGIAALQKSERYAPTSISQGRGVFSSARISISGPTRYTYNLR